MNNLPVSTLNSGELYTASKRITDVIQSSLSDVEYVAKLCSLLVLAIASLAKGLGKSLNSEFTSVLSQKDVARDNAFIGLRDFITSFCHSSDKAKLAAAILLSRIFEKAGNRIYAMGYTLETSKLNTLISDLSSASAQQALENIGATGWFNELVTTQEDFEKSYKTKIETEAAIDYPLVKESKEKITKYLKSVLNYIETSCELDSSKYTPVKDKLNKIITDVVTIARARATRTENEKKESAAGAAAV